MSNQRDYTGFAVATHPAPHLDEWFSIWSFMRRARLSPSAFVNFVDSAQECARMPEMTLFIGIGREEFDEHAPTGRPEGTSAASLTAGTLGLEARLEIKPILDAVHLGDIKGDQHVFNVDALLKPVCQLHPRATDLHRRLGVSMFHMFDVLAGYSSLDYPQSVSPRNLPEGLQVCTDASQVFLLWQQHVVSTKQEDCERAMKHMDKLWFDPQGEVQLLHLRNVARLMHLKRGPEFTYRFMEPLLEGFLQKQLDTQDYGRCHHDWMRAHKFETENGLKVAMVRTENPFLMGHLRRRKDLKNPELCPDIVVVRYYPENSPPTTTVWTMSEVGSHAMNRVVSSIARREFRLSTSQQSREHFATALEQALEDGLSRNLPKEADNWYLLRLNSRGNPTWSLMNGTLTRSVRPTRLSQQDWVEVLLPL